MSYLQDVQQLHEDLQILLDMSEYWQKRAEAAIERMDRVLGEHRQLAARKAVTRGVSYPMVPALHYQRKRPTSISRWAVEEA